MAKRKEEKHAQTNNSTQTCKRQPLIPVTSIA